MLTRLSLCAAALALLSACEGDGELLAPEGGPVIVDVRGGDGVPIRPDRVVWYYPPVDGRADEVAAHCADAGCTRWVVEGAREGRIYVEASYSRPTSVGCSIRAYDASPVQVRGEEATTVLLYLQEREGCF